MNIIDLGICFIPAFSLPVYLTLITVHIDVSNGFLCTLYVSASIVEIKLSRLKSIRNGVIDERF